MATGKGKKRALSFDSDDEIESRPSRGSKNNNNSNNDDWSAWQDGVRTQEAARVQQYVKTFQRDVLQRAHDGALASLRRQAKAHTQREADALARIAAECRWRTESDGEAQKQPLYVAGNQVLELLESTLDQYHRTEAALRELGGDNEEGDGLPSVCWDKDVAEARTLLSYGRAYGDGLVREIIVPAHGGTLIAKDKYKDKDDGLNATGKAALGMFPRSSTAAASQDTWGEAAQTQMEMLSRLMRTMAAGGGHSGGPLSSEKKTVRFDV